ncbi:MAG: hypothetical protein L0K86_22620 [Actinomycetia bacterium]|nr:hypothetical protein [Actinomycetes bacterium]
MAGRLNSRAWLLMGLTGSTPGTLRLDAGDRLSFTADGRGALTRGQLRKLERRSGRTGLADRLRGGAAEVVLDVPRKEIGDVRFPWYCFGAGMRFTVDGAVFRLSLLEPANTRSSGDPGVADIPDARASAAAWRATLTLLPGP